MDDMAEIVAVFAANSKWIAGRLRKLETCIIRSVAGRRVENGSGWVIANPFEG